MRDLEIRQDLDELDAKKVHNNSMFSKVTIEDKIKSEYVRFSNFFNSNYIYSKVMR